jgi:hypothetical protein
MVLCIVEAFISMERKIPFIVGGKVQNYARNKMMLSGGGRAMCGRMAAGIGGCLLFRKLIPS